MNGKGYPHKQSFNLKGFQRNNKRNAWYRIGKSRTLSTPKEK